MFNRCMYLVHRRMSTAYNSLNEKDLLMTSSRFLFARILLQKSRGCKIVFEAVTFLEHNNK